MNESSEKFFSKKDQTFEKQEGWNRASLDYSEDKYNPPTGMNEFYTEGYECGLEFCAASEATK